MSAARSSRNRAARMMTMRQRAERMIERDPNLSNAEIARRLGCTPATVWKARNSNKVREWVRRDNARRASEKRAWENTMRLPCPSCGSPMGAGSVRADGTSRMADVCPACRHERLVNLYREAVRLRREGDLSNREIAERLALPPLTIATRLKECRAMGVDVPCDPYNRPPTGYRKQRASAAPLRETDRRAVLEAFPEIAGHAAAPSAPHRPSGSER